MLYCMMLIWLGTSAVPLALAQRDHDAAAVVIVDDDDDDDDVSC